MIVAVLSAALLIWWWWFVCQVRDERGVVVDRIYDFDAQLRELLAASDRVRAAFQEAMAGVVASAQQIPRALAQLQAPAMQATRAFQALTPYLVALQEQLDREAVRDEHHA